MNVGSSRRLLTTTSVALFGAFLVEVVRTATMSSFVEFDPPVDLDLRTFPGAWERLGELLAGSTAVSALLGLVIAAIASPDGIRSRTVLVLIGVVGLVVSVIAVAAAATGPSPVARDIGRSVGTVVAYWALAVGAWRGIGSPSARQVPSQRVSTGFGILKEYE